MQSDGSLVLQAGGMDLACGLVVNTAGLGAVSLYQSLEGLPPKAKAATPPAFYLCKGNYFRLGEGVSMH